MEHPKQAWVAYGGHASGESCHVTGLWTARARIITRMLPTSRGMR